MSKLAFKAWLGFIALAIAMGLLLFVPAGTFHYWQAWAYLAAYFAPSFLITLYLLKNDPALLQRRMSGGPFAEKEKSQKIIMYFASIAFLAVLIVPALDHRFMWSHVPDGLAIAGDGATVLWFYLCFLVFKENTFTSATIEIADSQKVISTGPYAVVRHPMYVAGLFLFFGTPLALGSYWGLLAGFAALPALIWRLLDEERFLAANLPGYAGYCATVRWRLVPGVF